LAVSNNIKLKCVTSVRQRNDGATRFEASHASSSVTNTYTQKKTSKQLKLNEPVYVYYIMMFVRKDATFKAGRR